MNRVAPDRFRSVVPAAALVLTLPIVFGLHTLRGAGRVWTADWTNQDDAFLAAPWARSTVLAQDGSVLAQFWNQDRIPVRLDQVSAAARDAVIATEDARFYDHGAVDPQGLLRAVAANLAAGQVRQGASTLTQQYVKQARLLAATGPAGRREATAPTLVRKLRELGQAWAVEKGLSKDEILDRYLNIVYLGNGAYGIEAAAQRYFAVHATDLTVPQAALLAGILKSPRQYDPIAAPEAALGRRDVVLDRMVAAGRLDASAASRYANQPLGLNPTTPRTGCQATDHPFFCDYVLAEIRETPALGATPAERVARLLEGGLTVHTTLDPPTQVAAEAALQRTVPADGQYGAAIVLTEPGTGAVRALAQSGGYGTGSGRTTVNWALDAAQGASTGFQAGSTFKAFVLAAALDNGIAPATVIDAPKRVTVDGLTRCGAPGEFPPYEVGNHENAGYGPIDMRQATARSVNTYFVQLEQRTGLCAPADLAERMGLRRADGGPLSRVPSFTLGVDEVSPLRMAEAYATLAAGGLHCPSYVLSAVDGPDGVPLPLPGHVWAGHPDASRPMRDITVGDQVLPVATGGALPGRIWTDAMVAALGLPTDPAQREADAAARLATTGAPTGPEPTRPSPRPPARHPAGERHHPAVPDRYSDPGWTDWNW